ncbi:hypothetical protein LTR17_023679 [Elasticomyces elasticus]|nr:hypothetical protein LTR17_023679 [Elasticomyces elasticus]
MAKTAKPSKAKGSTSSTVRMPQERRAKTTKLEKEVAKIQVRISKLEEMHRIRCSRSILNYISNRFITQPGGDLQAVSHIFLLANKFIDDVMPTLEDGRVWKKDISMFSEMDDRLEDVLIANWESMVDITKPKIGAAWSLSSMQDQMGALLEKLRAQGITTRVFSRCAKVLRFCDDRRWNNKHVMAVVGHIFPTELVDMICEAAYEDDQLAKRLEVRAKFAAGFAARLAARRAELERLYGVD